MDDQDSRRGGEPLPEPEVPEFGHPFENDTKVKGEDDKPVRFADNVFEPQALSPAQVTFDTPNMPESTVLLTSPPIFPASLDQVDPAPLHDPSESVKAFWISAADEGGFTIGYGTTCVGGPPHDILDEFHPHMDSVKMEPVVSEYNSTPLDLYNPPVFPLESGIKNFWVLFSSTSSQILSLTDAEESDLTLAPEEVAIKIAVVDFGQMQTPGAEEDAVTQLRWGHIEVIAHSETSSGGSSSSSSLSGSDKSTCIVPDPIGEHSHVALFCVESPDVVFIDTMVLPYLGVESMHPIDKRFVGVCEPDTLKVAGITANEPTVFGCSIRNGQLSIKAHPMGEDPETVVVHLVGVRKKFLDHRFPKRNLRQFIMNEKFLNSAYPKE